jgi:glycosyltransferase involved in cell wall biosynthesis
VSLENAVPVGHAMQGLKIGVVTAFPPSRNSLNEFGFHLVRHLSRLEEVAEVIVFSDITDAGAPTPMTGVSVTPSWRFNALGNIRSLPAAITREQPDAVILNLQFATFGDRKVAGALGLLIPAVLRFRRVPTLLVLHNLADNVDMKDAGFAGSALTAKIMTLAGRVLTRALLRADLVSLTIPRYVEFLRSSYNAENAILAPHGSFEDMPTPSFSVPTGRRSIMAFGKWGTYKTVDTLVEAYQELIGRGYVDIRLVLAGTDSPNSSGYMSDAAKRYADVPHLEFPGYIEEHEVAPLFLSSSVVAFPYTSTTGSSGVLHQAGEYGRAVVLPCIGDLVDIIEEEGFLGVYFEPGDPTSLADAIAEVLDDPAKQEALGRRNFAAATGIPMSEVVQWHVAHIERMLGKRAQR